MENNHITINLNTFISKYSEWYSLCLDLEHTIWFCRGERVEDGDEVQVKLRYIFSV